MNQIFVADGRQLGYRGGLMLLFAWILAAHANDAVGTPLPGGEDVAEVWVEPDLTWRRRGLRTMAVGAGVTAAALPIGFVAALATPCPPQGRECYAPMVSGIVVGSLVGGVGLVIIEVGATEVIVDALHRRRVARIAIYGSPGAVGVHATF